MTDYQKEYRKYKKLCVSLHNDLRSAQNLLIRLIDGRVKLEDVVKEYEDAKLTNTSGAVN